jgi:hypothetical protein
MAVLHRLASRTDRLLTSGTDGHTRLVSTSRFRTIDDMRRGGLVINCRIWGICKQPLKVIPTTRLQAIAARDLKSTTAAMSSASPFHWRARNPQGAAGTGKTARPIEPMCSPNGQSRSRSGGCKISGGDAGKIASEQKPWLIVRGVPRGWTTSR